MTNLANGLIFAGFMAGVLAFLHAPVYIIFGLSFIAFLAGVKE